MKKSERGGVLPEESSSQDHPEARALEHIEKLLHDRAVPPLEGDLAGIPLLGKIHGELVEIRRVLRSLSEWNLAIESDAKGILPEYLKSLESNLRHVILRVQMVEQGDLTPQKHSMGEFSDVFNSMVKQLDGTLRDLRSKEDTLRRMAENLQSEVDQRNSAVEELQKSESRFRYLASHDALTGALNRRSFMERAAFELQVAISRNINCCFAIMDIDHFKNFNDRYGHLAGDDALRHAVAVVSACLRKMDFMGRYGGEEFVFFFHGADLKTGHTICERVRRSLAETPLELESGTVFIRASFGVTMTTLEEFSVPPEGLDFSVENTEIISQLLEKADSALYQAKANGRNQVCIYNKNLAERPVSEEKKRETMEGRQDEANQGGEGSEGK